MLIAITFCIFDLKKVVNLCNIADCKMSINSHISTPYIHVLYFFFLRKCACFITLILMLCTWTSSNLGVLASIVFAEWWILYQVPCGTEMDQKPPRCRKKCPIMPLCRHASICKVLFVTDLFCCKYLHSQTDICWSMCNRVKL